MSGNHRDTVLHDQMFVIAVLVLASVVLAIVAVGISVDVRGQLVPAVNAQVRHEIVALRCQLDGDQGQQALISCIPRVNSKHPR